MSNGWDGNQVTYGYWRLHSTPDFNPESDSSKRHHNVLIKDDTNELIIIGFEDIHREHSWCDHDFNDALFYVTATSYNDMKTTNLVDSSSSTDVYSANLGGFESKADLTGKMALKNINRLRTNQEASSKKMQNPFTSAAKNDNELAGYFPDKGMLEVEEPYISTSLDPVNYSNATDVFSIDYYLQEERVSAALVTTTESRIYDHSKHICDRLNGSTLKDIRPLRINNHHMIFSIIERANGYIEYTISFSVKKGETENTLYSKWNVGDYPEGDYLNFQIWGKSMGQVAHIVNHITQQLEEEKELVSETTVGQNIPTVFVSSASYRDQKLKIDFINKSNNREVILNANVRKSEQHNFYNMEVPISLTGNFQDSVELETGFIFEGGFALINSTNNTNDNVYIADGTWGIDYAENDVTIDSYIINEQIDALNEEVYQMERSVSVSGETKGIFNLFRYPLPGDLALNTEEFESIQFSIRNNSPITVSIVSPDIENWEDRWVYTIDKNEEEAFISINFNQFTNQNGVNNGSIDKVKMILFSVEGTEESPIGFNLDVKELAFASSQILSTGTFVVENKKVFNYPNPFRGSTTILLPKESTNVTLKVYDLLGRLVDQQKLTTTNRKSVDFKPSFNTPGVYLYLLEDENKNTFKGKFIIEN